MRWLKINYWTNAVTKKIPEVLLERENHGGAYEKNIGIAACIWFIFATSLSKPAAYHTRSSLSPRSIPPQIARSLPRIAQALAVYRLYRQEQQHRSAVRRYTKHAVTCTFANIQTKQSSLVPNNKSDLQQQQQTLPPCSAVSKASDPQVGLCVMCYIIVVSYVTWVFCCMQLL